MVRASRSRPRPRCCGACTFVATGCMSRAVALLEMAPRMSTSAWSLATTPPNRELPISRALSRWNYEHLLFKIRRRGMHRGRAHDRLCPAFPGYIWLVANNAWDTLRDVFGIVDFIGHGHLVERALKSLVEIADENGIIPTPERTSQRFARGDRVIVYNDQDFRKNGRAVFQYLTDDGKALVLLDWVCGQVPASVDERNLVLEVIPAPRRKRRRRPRRRNRQGAPHVMAA